MDDRLIRAGELYERAVFGGDDAALACAARELFLESTRLRREVGFTAGVAANLVGLAHLSSEPDEARAYLDEAASLAEEVGAACWGEIRELLTESYCLPAPKTLAALVSRPGPVDGEPG